MIINDLRPSGPQSYLKKNVWRPWKPFWGICFLFYRVAGKAHVLTTSACSTVLPYHRGTLNDRYLTYHQIDSRRVLSWITTKYLAKKFKKNALVHQENPSHMTKNAMVKYMISTTESYFSSHSPCYHYYYRLYTFKKGRYLPGWWFQPIWKIWSSNWKSSTNRGENKKIFETTT